MTKEVLEGLKNTIKGITEISDLPSDQQTAASELVNFVCTRFSEKILTDKEKKDLASFSTVTILGKKLESSDNKPVLQCKTDIFTD